jgi:hypothetical protein
MTTAPSRLGFPQVSVSDAHRLNELIEDAAAGLAHTLTEVRTLLQQRDLVALWDDESGSFRQEFLPLADRYHDLQNALLELNKESFGWQHDLSTFVAAQK